MSQKNRDDKMKSFLKGRLDGYKHPVDDDLWASIESELPASPKRRIKPVYVITAITGVAAILALMIVISHQLLTRPGAEPINADIGVVSIDKKPEITIKVAPEAIEENYYNPVTESIFAKDVPVRTEKSLVMHPVESNGNEVQPEKTIPEQSGMTDVIPETEPAKTEEIQPESHRDDVRKKEAGVNQRSYWETWPDEKPAKKRNRNNLSLAIAMNGASPDNANNLEKIIHGNDATEEIIEELVETNTNYDFPVTAGIILRYSFTKRLSLESGLNYTILEARDEITRDGVLESKGSYKLHYLGIPLRASFSIYDSPRLSVYGSAGVMMEKLVLGKSDVLLIPGMITETKDITANNLQWSVSGAIGINYKLNNTFGIFIEPGIGYYFDDGVGVPTIRRDRPLNFNLQVGLRINIK